MVDHLAYGDIIRIYCTLQDIQDKNQQRVSTKIAGFLLSKGFADNNIYFLKSKKFTEFEFRNSLFEILPYSSFEIHDENLNRLKQLTKNSQESASKNQDDENIKSRMETEKEQFKNKITKNRGLNINFDSEVVIRHVNSDSFLQGEFSCPETGIGSFKLVLTNEYSSLIKFKIIRFRNSDKQAEEIQSKDEFRLHHCASHCFLNIGSQEEEVFLDKPVVVELDRGDYEERRQVEKPILPTITDIFDEASMYHSMRPMIKKPTSISENNSQDDIPKRYEVVNQSKATLILNFMPEKKSNKEKDSELKNSEDKKPKEEQDNIEHNDIVYLKNTKNDSFLTVDLWTGEVYLKKLQENKICYQGLWEVCVRRDSEKGLISSNAGRTFYLKHYITDAVAKIKSGSLQCGNSMMEVVEGNSIMGSELQIQKPPDQSALNIRVDSLPDPKAKVMRVLKYPDSKGSLKHRDLVVLSVMTLEEKSGNDARMDFIDIGDPIKKIYMTDILKKSDEKSSSFKLKLCKGDIQNTFQVYKLDQKYLRDVNKILSCQEALAKFCDILIVFNKLLKRQTQISKPDRKPQAAMQSDTRMNEQRGETRKRRPSMTSNINSMIHSPKNEPEQAMLSTKEDHVDSFFNKFLNSYILLTINTTTQHLVNNCKTATGSAFEFIIMIRSLGIIEVLIEILYFIEQILSQWEAVFKGSSHSDNNLSKRKYEKDRLKEIFRDVYELLNRLSAENSCKIYMARWLSLFLKQYYKMKEDFMHKFILQVLQDSFVIKNCIKEDNIQECINELHDNFVPEAPQEKYLQLLSAFCRNKNSAVPSNQIYIMSKFLLPDEPCVFRFEMKKTEDPQQSQERKSSVAPKEDIKIITKNKNREETDVSMTDHNKFRKKELWTYTVTLLNLIADASFDQPIEKQILNRQPPSPQKSVISISVVTAFFNCREDDVSDEQADGKQPKTNNNIFEPFLKLAHYYIKQQNDGPKRLERNETVIVWDEGRSISEIQEFEDDESDYSEIGSDNWKLSKVVIHFFKELFNKELENQKYNLKKLRTIETSLDFIKTLMRTQSKISYPNLINSIIMSVMKLKSTVIYDGIDLTQLYNEVLKKHKEKEALNHSEKDAEFSTQPMTMDTEMSEQKDQPPAILAKSKEKQQDKFELYDKLIEKNYKKVLIEKDKMRLLIDTRSRAAEILDIYLDIENNQRLSRLINNVFLKLYKNDFDTGEDCNEPYSHRYKMVHQDTWVKEIIKICNTNPEDRLRYVRCLIECIFVDSLKVVDKMIVLMFKMYESRQLLLRAFSNTFICYERFYVDAYNEAKAWMASFQKIKENGDFSKSMSQLQGFSYMLRNPQPKLKRKKFPVEENLDDEDPFGDDNGIFTRKESRRTPTNEEQSKMEKEALDRERQYQARKAQEMAAHARRQTLVLNERETRFNTRQQQLQKLFINIKIHEFVLKYAKGVKPSENSNRDLNTVYEFLTLLVFDSTRNKTVLLQDARNLDIWEKHIKTNYKAVDFLREMLRNNKSLLFNKELVVRVVRMVLELCIEKEDYVLRAKLLEVLRVCCMYNNRVHPDNQTIILSLLQNKKYFDRVIFSSINYALCRKIDHTPVLMDVFQAFQFGVPDQLNGDDDQDDDIGYLSGLEEQLQHQQELPPEEQPEVAEPKPQLLETQEKPPPPSNYTCLTAQLQEYQQCYRQVCQEGAGEVVIPDMLQYVISFFSLMTALVDQNHKINVGKCSNIHTYDSLLVLLEDSRSCWPLSRFVRAYINRLYYENFTDKPNEGGGTLTRTNSQVSITRELKLKTESFLDNIFENELPLLNHHIGLIAEELHDPKKLYVVEQIRISRPVRYEYVVSYLYMYFVETLSGLRSILNSQQFKTVIGEKLKDTGGKYNPTFAELIQTIGEIYKRYRHIEEEPYVKKMLIELFDCCRYLIGKLEINNQFSKVFDATKATGDNIMFTEADPEEEKKLNKNDYQLCPTRRRLLYAFFIEERDDRTNKREVKEDAQDLFVKELSNLRLNPRGNHASIDTDEEIQLQVNDLLESVIERIRNTDRIKQMVQDELNELVELCCDLDCRSNIATIPKLLNGMIDQPRVLYKVITEKVFLQQVIKLVTKSPSHLQTSVKIRTIRFLRLIFEKKVNTKCGLVGKRKWESSYFKKSPQKDKLEEVQSYFLKLKLGEMIVKILQTDNPEYELLMETFMIGVCFLFNGNTKCQMSILVKLRENPENEVMTQLCQFIRNIRNDIETEKFQTEEKLDTRSDQPLPDKRRTMTDSYNYYDRELNCMVQASEDRDTNTQSGEVSKKIRCVCKAYNFLQLLCENDNTQLKDFLRQQTNTDKSTKYNSVNFLAETTKLFKIVLEKLAKHERQKDLIEYIAEFIVEVTQIPCITNQRELCNTSIFQDIRSFLDRELQSRSEVSTNQSVLYLMDFVINVGLSLLQGNEDTIYNNLLKSLDARFLYSILMKQNSKLIELKKHNAECPSLTEINEQTLRVLMKEDQGTSGKEIRQRLEYVFNLLGLIKKLSHYQTKKKVKPTLLAQITDDKFIQKDIVNMAGSETRFDTLTIKKLCDHYIQHIEVQHNDKKQYLYFPKLPIFSEISIQTQEYINENVKRQTQTDKITDFLSKSHEVNNQMNWNYKVQNRLNSSSKTLDQLRRNITLLTLLIEVIFIVFSTINFTLNRERKEVVKMIKLQWVGSLLHLLAIIQLFGSVYFLYVWVTLKYRLAVQRQVQKNKTDLNMQFVQSMLAKIDKDEQFDHWHYWYCAKLMYQHQPEIYNTLFFVVTSFSGYLFGYEYYSLMVFDVLSRNKTLKNVIQAITLNMKQLFYVSLLILVFVYVFNMISIEFDLYLPYIYEAEEEKCEVLSDCIMSLYTSGIVGTKDQDLRMGRYFTDLLYIVIMELLFSNIVSGIMIDTFAQLRDKRKKIEIDQQNQCFICGITKAAIEKRMKEETDENSDQYFKDPNNRGVFYYHTQYVHKQWNYIYYLYILRQKDITAYTGIEYAIKKQLDDDQFKWVPIEYEKNENDVDQLLDMLSVKLKKRLEGSKEPGRT